MTTWALVPCSKSKATHSCAAREMYWPSAQFRGAYRVATSRGQTILILSAKYGLLHPDAVIKPYDETLKDKTRFDRARWAGAAFYRILDRLRSGDCVVSYLGAVYAEDLVRLIRDRGSAEGGVVEEPLKGLGQGKRLAWFKAQLERGDSA